jgi:NAD+ synthase (glutamine-hydrolysing)
VLPQLDAAGPDADPRLMRVAIAQVNPVVGDLRGNRRLVEEAAAKAAEARADVVVLPELVLTGYPPMDLLLREGFVRDQLRELDALLPASKRVPILLGAVLPGEDTSPGELHNAAVLLADGRRAARQDKTHLPTYDVFDEKRYFRPTERRSLCELAGVPVGLTVCEDSWADARDYAVNPIAELAADGARCIFNISASPWRVDKASERRTMISRLARDYRAPIVFVNQVGGNDELIFDGGSFVCDAQGRVIASLPLFEPAFEVIDLDAENPSLAPDAVTDPSHVEQLEAGLTLGIGDYFHKQGLPPDAVIGLSGGIDSAVTAHLACLALGPESLLGIAMPGPFSSTHSVEDALELGRNLGIEVRTVDITRVYESYVAIFGDLFGVRDDYGIAQQNIQSRIRGATLMAVSNAEGRLVLATGNKSELSMGYCTLYGDTVGGIAVLGDVYKRDVYALARLANLGEERIPLRTIEKPPSAELAPDQLDSDDLPPYDILDAVLEQAIEGQRSASGIEVPPGTTAKAVRDITKRLDRNEYKRRQAPLVLRTSPKAFGSGRRLPIVHRYIESDD